MVECAHMMHAPVEKQDSREMRAMFGAIAPRYDFVTKIFSYGMDGKWKRAGVQECVLPENAVVLDLAAGTGDFSKLVMARLPQARAIAVDLTEPMLLVARETGIREAVCGDAGAIDRFSAMLEQTGYEGVKARSFILGGIGLHSAIKATRHAKIKPAV